MSRFILAMAAVAAVMAPCGAYASKQIKNKAPIVVDAKLGYVLLRVGPATSDKGYAPNVILYRIDPATSRLRTAQKASANPVAKGEDVTAIVGGSRPFGNATSSSVSTGVFLTSLTPGEWVIAGTESTCFCMGSYRFTVLPGEITDLGTVITNLPNENTGVAEFAGQTVADDLADKAYTMPDLMVVRPAVEGDAVPALLASLPRKRAELVYTRFDNAGGWMVSRMAGLPAMGHETAEAAAAVTDPRVPMGTGANRWPDVKDETTPQK